MQRRPSGNHFWLLHSAAAALFPSACHTILNWPDWKRQLIFAAQTSLPIGLWSSGQFWPSFWDSVPFALNLDFAFRCFPGHRMWAQGARKTIHEISNNRSIGTPGNLPDIPNLQSKTYANFMIEMHNIRASEGRPPVSNQPFHSHTSIVLYFVLRSAGLPCRLSGTL